MSEPKRLTEDQAMEIFGVPFVESMKTRAGRPITAWNVYRTTPYEHPVTSEPSNIVLDGPGVAYP